MNGCEFYIIDSFGMAFSIENKIIYVLVWVNGCEIELKDSLGMAFSIENKKIFVLVWRIFVSVALQQSFQFPTKNSELKPQREHLPNKAFISGGGS